MYCFLSIQRLIMEEITFVCEIFANAIYGYMLLIYPILC